MALKYANGKVSGVGYMEVWSPAPAYISGNRRVREVFTVSGWDRKVAKVSVRLKRIAGNSPLKLRLLKGSGKPVVSGSVSAARIALHTVSDIRRGSDWVTLRLDRRVRLKRGQKYRLVLSTAADTRYALHVIREGKSHGYPPSTFFRDGHAELDTGSGWQLFQRWGNRSDEADLQFYFR
jgi:hypothetical protein